MLGGVEFLVVDDDRAIGIVLTGLLRQAGARAFHASHAAEALAVLARQSFDCVITDLRMPGDGRHGPGFPLESELARAARRGAHGSRHDSYGGRGDEAGSL